MDFYDLASEVILHYFCHSLITKEVIKLLIFQEEEMSSALFAGISVKTVAAMFCNVSNYGLSALFPPDVCVCIAHRCRYVSFTYKTDILIGFFYPAFKEI